MTTIDFTTVIRWYDNEPMKGKDGMEPLTLATIAVDALGATFPDETHLPGEEKARRFAIAMRIYGKCEVTLKAEEVTLLKTLIGKGYNPVVVGRAYEILDPPAPDKA